MSKSNAISFKSCCTDTNTHRHTQHIDYSTQTTKVVGIIFATPDGMSGHEAMMGKEWGGFREENGRQEGAEVSWEKNKKS